MEVISVTITRTAAIVAAAAAALAGTSYAATVGVQQVLRSSSRATVEPPSLFKVVGKRGGTLKGTAGPDTLLGGPGRNRLYGADGNDVIEGAGGNDVLAGGRGHDVINGGPGNDVIFGRDGCRDVIDGGPGNDTVKVDQFDVVRNVEHVLRANHAPTCS
jgi:Ca2+-binding RTX toxin-like protein